MNLGTLITGAVIDDRLADQTTLRRRGLKCKRPGS